MNIPPVSSQAQEAMETAAQTRVEAAQGDVQAKLKLAQAGKLQGHLQPTSAAAGNKAVTDAIAAAPSIPPPPTGAVLNVKR